MSDDEPPPLEDMEEYLNQRETFRQRQAQKVEEPRQASNATGAAPEPVKVQPKPKPKKKDDGFGSGFKKGFLGGGSSSKSKPASSSSKKEEPREEIPVFKPKMKDDDSVMNDLKNIKLDKENPPTWMQPNEDLMKDVVGDNMLLSAMNNPRVMKAIDEISKDPNAANKYKDDKEVMECLTKMMGLFGKQFEKQENASQ
eukprot:GFYU01005257.1.p1 GENE.GFYU01005257.1~~GFYU01005257.1.p1  ORF type:complete len:198 (+),score=59.77 GFYU01005257.1:36-629(+)